MELEILLIVIRHAGNDVMTNTTIITEWNLSIVTDHL